MSGEMAWPFPFPVCVCGGVDGVGWMGWMGCVGVSMHWRGMHFFQLSR